ncbi:MAG: coiled-coil protein [Candidatus Odinarchaeia archaeon]
MGEDLIPTLEELKTQATELKNERDKYNELAKKYIKERDIRNNEIARLLNEAKNKKEKRDKVNNEVANLKAKKIEIEAKIREYQQLKAELENKLKEINAPRIPLHALKNRIKDLEWKLQTSVLKLDEENRIIKTIAELEEKLAVKKEEEKIKNQLLECKTQLTANRIILRDLKKAIITAAKNSQNEHISMGDIYKQVDEIRKEADEYHQKFLENKAKADEYHNKYVVIRKEMRKIISQIHKMKEAEKKSRQKSIEVKLDKMAQAAQEKLKSGEKLSFDEFQILMEKGLI